ncbi:MAG: CbtB-domain containing protein [Candidatus Devosia symbiotica]|nr:CbtB-domain containing protein [Candidatus Devosia symbiotica]
MNTTTNMATGLQSLSIAQRLIASVLAPMLGLTLLIDAGFSSDYRLHNGAHDTRRAMGLLCH